MILEPIISEHEIKSRIDALVQDIVESMPSRKLTVVGLLKGSFMFMSDMVRALHNRDFHLIVDFMGVSSYGSGTTSTGEIKLIHDLSVPLQDSHILLIDDIMDTGNTIHFVLKYLMAKKPASLKTCVLLDKSERRIIDYKPDFIGFSVPNEFVVGYGLDYAHHHRELPYIATLTLEEEK